MGELHVGLVVISARKRPLIRPSQGRRGAASTARETLADRMRK